MPTTFPAWMRLAGRVLLTAVAGVWMVACNLGPQAPEPPTPTPPIVVKQDIPTLTPTLSTLVPLQITPSATPPPQLLPQETLGPITIDGVAHRTLEPVTVRVRYGKSVSKPTCSFILQDTSQTTALTGGSTTQVDATTSEDAYTFTPEAAGTYQVNCTGIALTASGQRAVSAAGPKFAVEAKG